MESKKKQMPIDKSSAKKLAWLILCLLALQIFFQGFPSRFIKIFSWSFIQREGAYPWIVLSIGIIWLFLKKEEIRAKLYSQDISSESVAISLPILFASILLHRRYSYLGIHYEVLFLLMTFLGIFVMFFKEALTMPTIPVALYGFTVIFPAVVARYFDEILSMTSLYTTMLFLRLLRVTTFNKGQVLYFVDKVGKSRSVLINSQCAGIAGITLFIILYFLMSLDIPLPRQKATNLFIFGIVGTFLQNIIRILSLIIAGYYFGMDALWKTHKFAGYVIFPAWFVLFAYVYLTEAKEEGLEERL